MRAKDVSYSTKGLGQSSEEPKWQNPTHWGSEVMCKYHNYLIDYAKKVCLFEEGMVYRCTGWSNWTLLRKFKHFICCLIYLYLVFVWHLSNSIWNIYISGFKSSWTSLHVIEFTFLNFLKENYQNLNLAQSQREYLGRQTVDAAPAVDCERGEKIRPAPPKWY